MPNGSASGGRRNHADPPSVLQALAVQHRPLGAYEVIDELAKSMPRPRRSRYIARSIS